MMSLIYTAKLGFTTQKTSIAWQKIDDLPLVTNDMTSAKFLLQDSLGKIQFFEEIFLLADTSVEAVLGIPFVSLNILVKFLY